MDDMVTALCPSCSTRSRLDEVSGVTYCSVCHFAGNNEARWLFREPIQVVDQAERWVKENDGNPELAGTDVGWALNIWKMHRTNKWHHWVKRLGGKRLSKPIPPRPYSDDCEKCRRTSVRLLDMVAAK